MIFFRGIKLWYLKLRKKYDSYKTTAEKKAFLEGVEFGEGIDDN